MYSTIICFRADPLRSSRTRLWMSNLRWLGAHTVLFSDKTGQKETEKRRGREGVGKEQILKVLSRYHFINANTLSLFRDRTHETPYLPFPGSFYPTFPVPTFPRSCKLPPDVVPQSSCQQASTCLACQCDVMRGRGRAISQRQLSALAVSGWGRRDVHLVISR